jgi:hypothetical protein
MLFFGICGNILNNLEDEFKYLFTALNLSICIILHYHKKKSTEKYLLTFV